MFQQRKVYFIIVPAATGILFSGSYVAAKFTTLDLGPLTTTALRYLVALLFFLVLIPLNISTSLKIQRAHLLHLFLLGVFGIVGYHFFFLVSLRYTAVANTAIINAFSPILTSLLAALFIKERLTRRNYIGIVLAFCGVITLLVRGDINALLALQFNVGDGLMLCATLSWVCYALIIKKLSGIYNSFTLTFYALLFGVILLLFLTATEHPIRQLASISANSILSILYMGICASGVGYLLYNISIHDIGPTRTSSFVYSIVPILVAILAYLFFAEPFTLSMGLSIFAIVVGLLLMLKTK